MKEKKIFEGVGTAIITPMKEDGSINETVFKDLIEWQVNEGADAVVVAGTTGEACTLSDEEHLRLVECAVDTVQGRIPVIAGAGSNDTAHAIFMEKECEKLKADAILSVTPYYNKTSQEGIYQHYRACASQTTLPILVYNVPSRTGVTVMPQTYERLAEIDNIVGCKEAGTDMARLAETAALCSKGFAVYSGNDDLIVPTMALGASGVISVLSNLAPRQVHDLVMECLHGDWEQARKLQFYYMELNKALFSDVSPMPVKYAMEQIGFDVGVCRLPLCEISNEKKRKMQDILEKYCIKK